MTDQSKIEAAAREAAIDHGEWLEADADETNFDAFVAGFMAGHASRDEEVNELQDELSDWREDGRKAAEESCGDDREHCTCVGVLRHEIAALRAKLEAAEARAAKLHDALHSAARALPLPGES